MARKLYTKPKWYTFPKDKDIQFLLKPVSMSQIRALQSENSDQVATSIQMFCDNLLDWKGILDDDNNLLECNTENKKSIGELHIDLFVFVNEELLKMTGLNISKDESKN